jgi:hypothetical protein
MLLRTTRAQRRGSGAAERREAVAWNRWLGINTLQYEKPNIDGAIRHRPLSFEVLPQTLSIGKQRFGIIDYAPKSVALGMSSIVLNIDNQLSADVLRVSSVPNKLQFQNQAMRWKEEIHPSAGPSVARRKFFGPNIGNPWAQQGVE